VAGPWNADLPGSLRPAPDLPGILSYTDDTSLAPSPRIYRIRLIPPD